VIWIQENPTLEKQNNEGQESLSQQLVELLQLSNHDQVELHSASDEERPKKRQRVEDQISSEHVPSEDSSSPHMINGALVADSFEMEGYESLSELSPYYASHDHSTLVSNT
jgi:hypothetical protein